MPILPITKVMPRNSTEEKIDFIDTKCDER